MSSGSTSAELRLFGAGGEPVDFWRTVNSHGLVELPPMRIDAAQRRLEVTLPVERARPRTVQISSPRPGSALIRTFGPQPGPQVREQVVGSVRRLLSLDEDLSPFYELAAADPELAWAAQGAGRMIRSATVFEDVVKTICTTNCAWSATTRMVNALVSELGAVAVGGKGRSFPSAAELASADDDFYRDVVRAGYRGRYLRELSERVAAGSLDLEELRSAPPSELTDEDLEQRLLNIAGIGPYAAAHIMMLLGRYSRLVLDSWTRPKYARLNGGRPVKDGTIVRRYRRYGGYAGLAFWLHLTRGWVDPPSAC